MTLFKQVRIRLKHFIFGYPELRTPGLVLENSTFDARRKNAFQSYPVLGYIVDGQLDPARLKSALERVIHHFPVLAARMCRNGKELMIPEKPGELFSWTVLDYMQPLASAFAVPAQSDAISVTRLDTRARADFYIPLKSTVVSQPSVADERSPLIEVRVQRFIDKTVIGISWNHLLTDGGGFATVLSSWTKALRGESLPEAASNKDPFQAHYNSNPTPPPGTVDRSFSKKVKFLCAMIIEMLCYGSPEPRSIFIPNSVLHQWKFNSPDLSTNDLIAAWLLKAWASTATRGTVSYFTIMDLRKHLPKIVPQTYLRNGCSTRASPHALNIKDINEMSHPQVAKLIRSFVNYFTPEVELNYQSYEYFRGGKGYQVLPKVNRAFVLSSSLRFNFPQMDFGAKTESFEGFIRLKRDIGNVGNVWLEDGGARISFWMSKRRWNMGIWRTIQQSDGKKGP